MSKYTKKAIFQMLLKSIVYKRDPSVFWLKIGIPHDASYKNVPKFIHLRLYYWT